MRPAAGPSQALHPRQRCALHRQWGLYQTPLEPPKLPNAPSTLADVKLQIHYRIANHIITRASGFKYHITIANNVITRAPGFKYQITLLIRSTFSIQAENPIAN